MADKKEYKPTSEDIVRKDGTVIVGGNKKVSIVIPKEPGVKTQIPVYAKMGDKTALIERGKTVTVGAPMAEMLKESERRIEIADDYYNSNSK